MTLFWHHFRAYLSGLLIWAGVGMFLTFAITRSAPAVVADGAGLAAIQALPEAMRAMLGYQEGLSPLDSFITLKFSAWSLLVASLYGSLLALSIVTREVDRRTIDFLLSLPVGRTQVLLSRVGVMLLNSGLVMLGMWLVLRYDLAAQGLEGSWTGYGLMMLNQWLVAVAIASLALLSSLWIDDYSHGVKIWMGAVTGLFFIELAMRAANFSRWQRGFSPFSYADAAQVIRAGQIPLADAAILVAVALLAIAVSVPVFERKQLTA